MIFIYIGGSLFLFLFRGCVGNESLSCNRLPSAVTECPRYPSSGPEPRTEAHCKNDGCYYCGNLTPSCVEGAGCSRIDMSIAQECKDGTLPVLARWKCRQLNCAWCESQSGVKCYKSPTSVDEIVPPPITACTGSETLHCFPFPTINVTEAQCNSEVGCAYCSNATDDKKCMRSQCPSGWTLRKDGKSCCEQSSNPLNSGRSMSWLVEYQADQTVCEGFVASSTRVITAGQCLTTNNGVLVLGVVKVNSDDVSQADTLAVTEVVRSSYYINFPLFHDILVLKLANSVPTAVQPLSLPLGETPPVGMTCYIGTFEGNTLAQYPAVITANSECLLKDEYFASNFQLCATLSTPPTCAGKPGSPIVCQRCSSCDWYAFGITSYTLDCTVSYPTYHTKITPYITDLIQSEGIAIPNTVHNCDMI